MERPIFSFRRSSPEEKLRLLPYKLGTLATGPVTLDIQEGERLYNSILEGAVIENIPWTNPSPYPGQEQPEFYKIGRTPRHPVCEVQAVGTMGIHVGRVCFQLSLKGFFSP